MNRVTLYEGSRDELRPVPIDDLPHDMAEALNLDQPTALVQVMTTPVGTTFHGQGGEIDRRKGELRDYFRMIDRALHSHLSGSQRLLLFAGVEYLFPIYSEVNSYSHLFQTALAGNPERLGGVELHRRAEELLAPYRRRTCEADASRYETSAGARRTTERLDVVLAEAHSGAVDVLFLADHETRWGRYDAATRYLDLTSSNDPIACDLYDLAAYQTLKHRGRVHVVPAAEVPHRGPCAALLRFARSPAESAASS
jgi:hypothetical protein